jgi:hypothetical protein
MIVLATSTANDKVARPYWGESWQFSSRPRPPAIPCSPPWRFGECLAVSLARRSLYGARNSA